MFTDPLVLTTTLASILPVNGGFTEQTFRVADVGDRSSVRVATPADLTVASIKMNIKSIETGENKAAGIRTVRTSVGMFFTSPKAIDGVNGVVTDPTEVRGSVNVVLTHPQGLGHVTSTQYQRMLAQLIQFLLTESDNATANTAITVSDARLARLLQGEP